MRVSYVRGGSRAIWHCCIHRPRRFVVPRYDAWVRLAVLVALLVAACGRIGFESSDEQFLPAHLDERPPHATASLVLRDTIDTTALTIDGTAPAPGASFSTRLQQAGPEVALLVAGDVTVPAGSTVRVIGTRPLVIVATAIQIDGVIDAGARGATPGPGGGASGQGAGAGSSTQKPAADVCDPGAGGGGFAQAGASGGSESCTGDAGAGGVVYGDDMLVTLVAGSGGGRGSGGDCASSAGGGGGGAIQLTAFRLLSVTEGLIAFYEGDYAQALMKAKTAFELAPWLYEAHVLEGDVHTADATDKLGRGDYEAARAAAAAGALAYAAAEALAPSDAALLDAACEGRRVGAWIDFTTGRSTAAHLDEAIAPCDRAHTADPEQPGPLVRGARILANGANVLWTSRGIAPEPLIERAIARANQAMAVQPGLAQAWYARGIALSVRGRAEIERGSDPRATLGAANEDFEKAIALDEDLAGAYADACITYQHIADWHANHELDPIPALERAIAVGQRGVVANPDNVHARRSLGTAWLRRGMWEADHNVDPAPSFEHASNEYAAILAINPKEAATINNDAMVRDMVGTWRLDRGVVEGEADLDRAEARYLEALKLQGDNSDTLNNLGHLCWSRARHHLRTGRDVRPQIDAGLAYLARALKRNPNEVNVYFNELQLHLLLAEQLLQTRSSPAASIEAALAAIAAHRRVNPSDIDIDGLEAEAHILAARALSTAGRDPSAEFALAEKALARAAAAEEPTTYTLTAQADLHRYRADWLVANGRTATADLAAGDAAIEKLVAIDHGAADTRLLRGALLLVRARAATQDVAARRDAATRARTELAGALDANRFLEREAKPLIGEAEALAGARGPALGATRP